MWALACIPVAYGANASMPMNANIAMEVATMNNGDDDDDDNDDDDDGDDDGGGGGCGGGGFTYRLLSPPPAVRRVSFGPRFSGARLGTTQDNLMGSGLWAPFG